MAQTVDPGRQFDPSFQSEELAFKPADMIACTGCERANPPNRLACLYCGKELEFRQALARNATVSIRRLECYERGWNIIASIGTDLDPTDAGKIAFLLSKELTEISEILETRLPLPIVRVDSHEKAGILSSRLTELGLDCRIVSDAELNIEKPPVRLKRIEFGQGKLGLINFNTGEVVDLAAVDIALIVKGQLISSRTDLLERKRRRGNTTILDESYTVSDEMVADLYTRGDSVGYRVRLAGFDFSCLGEGRALVAAANMNQLIEELVRFAPDAKVIDDYVRVGHLLDVVWEKESRRDSQGLQRVGLGKREFGAVATTNNFAQFTNFSRLQWHLL